MSLRHYLSALIRSRDSRRKQPRLTKKPSRRLLLEPLEDRHLLATFLVTNTDAFGPGSLWQAVFDAENTPNTGGQPDEVHFDIPNPGVHTIHLNNSLPIIADPVIIDGYTQSGASPNALAVGDNAVLKIEIDGSAMPPGTNLFNFRGDHSTVRGLAVMHVPGICFDIGFGGFFSSNNTIAGNFIGTDASGLDYLADTGYAIQVGHSSLGVQANGNVIGGTAPADRNVITGQGAQMIAMGDAHGTLVQGNYIGVNRNGTGHLQPPVGSVAIGIGNGSGGNIIGGTEAGAGNLILGTSIGIGLFEGSTGSNVVQGNFIGTDATGTVGLGSGIGIQINSANNSIGGSAPGAGNLLSGNVTGLFIGAPGQTIQGNKIGTDNTGLLPNPNSNDGIAIYGVGGATIGGTNPGEGNTIAFNGGVGARIGQGTGWSLSGNSIFSNGGRGILIDVGNGEPQPNDPGDADAGPNGVQNYPVLSLAGPAGSQAVVVGTLNSTSNTTFHIEFFASNAGDPSGFGEGQTLLGFTKVTTDGNGDASFTAIVPGNLGLGQAVTATATNPGGSTSEFAHNVTAASLDVIIDANTPQDFLDSLRVVYGNLILVGVAGRVDLLLPNLTQVVGDFIVTGNPDLTTISVPLLTTVGGNVDISDNPALTNLNLGSITTTGGDLTVDNNGAITNIDLGTVSAVGGNVSVSGNITSTNIDLGSLTNAGGSVSVSGNASTTNIDLGSLTHTGGNLTVDNNGAATNIGLGSLINTGGDLAVDNNGAATNIDLGGVTTVGGSLSVEGNTTMTGLSVGNATRVGGSVIVRNNPSLPSLLLPKLIDVGNDFVVTLNPVLTMFDVPKLASVGGDTDVSDNQSMFTVDLSSFTSAGGSVNINGNTAATGIDVSSLTTLDGNVSISGNTSANGIDVSSLMTVNGNVDISGNTAATGIDVSSLTTVDGNVSISGNTSATGIDASALSTVGGDETLESQNSITAVTADGSTEVKLVSAEAQMTAFLPTDTFDHAVGFSVTRLDPANLPPEPGTGFSASPAMIDPLAAYQFHFDIPTLGQEAALTFEITVADLSLTERPAFLAALAAGEATVAVKNDSPGSVYQAFAIAAPGQPLDATHVTIARLDANHNPLPPGSTVTPAFVRFDGVTGHFSTFAVVIVSGSNSPPVANNDAALLNAGTSININVLANDTDPDGDHLTVTAVTQPASHHGKVTINANGSLTYTQTVFVNGTETLTYTISDGHGGTATATVTVTVNLPAKIGIDMLVAQVKSSNLRHGNQTSLIAKLNATQKSLTKGQACVAARQLTAFANEVRALKRNHALEANQADLWLSEVDSVLAILTRATIGNQQLMRLVQVRRVR